MQAQRSSMVVIAALSAVLLAAASAQAQVCVIPATVDSTSQVMVGGVIKTPIPAKVMPVAKTTFSGQVAIVLPAPCPTAATLPAALSKAYIATVKGTTINLADNTAVVTMGTSNAAVAKVAVTGVKGTTISKVGGYAAPTVTALAGTVTTSNSPIPISPFNMAGQSMTIGGGCSLTASGTTVVFSCPKLSIAQPLNLEYAAGSKGSGTLQIQGSLSATGKLSAAKVMPAGSVPPPAA